MLLHARPCSWLLRVTRATHRLRVRAQVAARMLVARAVASRRGGCVGRGRPVSVALVVSEMHFADLRNRLQGQSQFGRVRIVARVGHWVEVVVAGASLSWPLPATGVDVGSCRCWPGPLPVLPGSLPGFVSRGSSSTPGTHVKNVVAVPKSISQLKCQFKTCRGVKSV